ncbi:FHA domain-containing protein [Corallococcus caeni]|uniref:FHA domain-containing protein n=1 Tax=Corallococcus caeni TaxID=3082388 RepID=A0ABQ6QJ73_9BACT|nr:hypothetical protein ASNO1_01440 [Corallococcus sp. NO1]
MNRIRETIEVAEPLWRALEQMSHDLGVDRDALVAQALFLLAKQNGYVSPTPVVLGTPVDGAPVRAPAARAPEPAVRPAEPPTTVAPVKAAVSAAPPVDEAAHARSRMQEVLAAVDAVVQPRDVPVAADDEDESEDEEEASDESEDEEEASDESEDEEAEAADASSDEDEASDDEEADEDEAAGSASSDEDEASDEEESGADQAADESSDESEAADEDEAADEGASETADEDEESDEDATGTDAEDEKAAEEDDGSAADIEAAIGSEELPGDNEADDSEPEEAKTGEEAIGSDDEADARAAASDEDDAADARAAASDEDDERAAASDEDDAQGAGSSEAEEQDLPFVAAPAAKGPALRKQGRVLRQATPEDDAPPDANKGRKPAARASARKDLFVRLSPDGPATRVDVERFTLGRGPQCSLVVKSGRVSREHAIVVREGNDYFIEDLGSSNGTWINHQRIKRQKIADGDTFNLGTEAVYFSMAPSDD